MMFSFSTGTWQNLAVAGLALLAICAVVCEQGGWLQQGSSWLFAIVVGAHAIEFVVIFLILRKIPYDIKHFLPSVVLGFTYTGPLLKQHGQDASQGQ